MSISPGHYAAERFSLLTGTPQLAALLLALVDIQVLHFWQVVLQEAFVCSPIDILNRAFCCYWRWHDAGYHYRWIRLSVGR